MLVVKTREHIQHNVNVFERMCKRMKLNIKKDQTGSCEKVRASGEQMQEMDKFKYLRLIIWYWRKEMYGERCGRRTGYVKK